jgi:uncharacterized membrane protein
MIAYGLLYLSCFLSIYQIHCKSVSGKYPADQQKHHPEVAILLVTVFGFGIIICSMAIHIMYTIYKSGRWKNNPNYLLILATFFSNLILATGCFLMTSINYHYRSFIGGKAELQFVAIFMATLSLWTTSLYGEYYLIS